MCTLKCRDDPDILHGKIATRKLASQRFYEINSKHYFKLKLFVILSNRHMKPKV